MELDSSPGVILFLFSRENRREAERPNTPFCMNLLVDLDSSSLTLIYTLAEVAEDRCQAPCDLLCSSRISDKWASCSFFLLDSTGHCRSAHFSNKMPW